MLSWKVDFLNKMCIYPSTFATVLEISQDNILTRVISPDCMSIQNLIIENTKNLFGLHKHIDTCMHLLKKRSLCLYMQTHFNAQRKITDVFCGKWNEMTKIIFNIIAGASEHSEKKVFNNWNLHYV